MSAAEIKKLTCPSCNAPLKITGDAPTMTCTYCQASVKIPKEYKPIRPFSPPPNYPSFNWYTNPRFIISVVAVVILVMVRIFSGGGSSSRRYPNSPKSSPWSSSDTSTHFQSPWLLRGTTSLKTQEGSDEISYVIIENASTKDNHVGKIVYHPSTKKVELAWVGAPLPGKNTFNIRMAKGDQTVFLVVDNQLISFDAKSGKTGFTSTLTDAIQCDSCVAVYMPYVSVATKDKNLQTFNALTGKLIWQEQLAETPNALYQFGNQIGTHIRYQKLEGEIEKVGYLQFYHIEKGDPATLLLPKGSKEPGGNPQTASSSALILQDKEQPEIFYFVMGGSTNRFVDIQKWNAKTNSRDWERHLAISLKPSSSFDNYALALSKEHFFMTNGPQITAFNVSNGNTTEIRSVENANAKTTFEANMPSRIGIVGNSDFYPLFEQNGELFVEEHTKNGTKKIQIMSIPFDKSKPSKILKSIVPKWSFHTTNVKTQRDLADGESAMVETGVMAWAVKKDKLYLVSAEEQDKKDDSKVLVYQTIDLTTGNPTNNFVVDIEPFTRLISVSPDSALVHMGGIGPQLTWLYFSSKDKTSWPTP